MFKAANVIVNVVSCYKPQVGVKLEEKEMQTVKTGADFNRKQRR